MKDFKKIEIFCGTGGVGKTTISASRAFSLAARNKKVLLITIDPAKRLRQLLNLKDQSEIVEFKNEEISFDVLLLDCKSSFEKILGAKVDNKILENLTSSRGGLNEILAVLEIQSQINRNIYDAIVVDTAPGKNFLDFLNSSKKINRFFNKTFAEAFNYITNQNKPGRFFNRIISTGIEKFLSYLESVTGQGFINDFLEAISILYGNREKFIDGLSVEKTLNDPAHSRWYLVTSAEHMKEVETKQIFDSIQAQMNTERYLIINKSWYNNLASWQPKTTQMQEFKETIIKQEEIKTSISKKSNIETLTFPDLVTFDPIEQLRALQDNWKKTEKEV
ncbi:MULTISPECIES: ArsA family ATPase [Pseudomonadati]|uniref:ArsA family ATPase n=1 Tax=unclassified Halobacteriovorax TaxID=2639665 RepID=UPI000CD12710|nr:ArsA-related P-loop ATPase [Halobacteriovorax sp. DA5]POB12851.1 hypothetical protein C0Z22_13310 [Halobacteriovorax sp. DA5]